MRWLLFLSRLSFICGVFFLMSLSLLIWDWLHDNTVISTIVTIGYLMGMIVVPVTVLSYGIVLIIRKEIRSVIPRWLITANILFLLLLIFFIFYWNDPYYHQR